MPWDSDIEAKVKEQLESITAKYESELDKLKKKVDGAELLLANHKTEIGEARKEIKRAIEVGETIGDKDAFKKTLDKISKITDDTITKLEKAQASTQGRTEDTQDVEKQLTEEQRQVADEKYKLLVAQYKAEKNPTKRQEYETLLQGIASKPEERTQFLKAAIEAAPSVPDSLFGSPSKNATSDANRYRALFGLANKESSFLPGARQMEPSGFSGASKPGQKSFQSEPRLTPTGILPRPGRGDDKGG